jgi:hypothetical protein
MHKNINTLGVKKAVEEMKATQLPPRPIRGISTKSLENCCVVASAKPYMVNCRREREREREGERVSAVECNVGTSLWSLDSLNHKPKRYPSVHQPIIIVVLVQIF